MRNGSVQETDVLSEALRHIATLLPATWSVENRIDFPGEVLRSETIIDLIAPSGERVSFAVEAKRSGSASIAYVLSTLRELQREHSMPMLFVSAYIGPTLRTALAAEGISFADGTGWVNVVSEQPLIMLRGQGAKRSPRPSHASAVVRMNGVAANRTIRALTITSPPIGVRALADLAGVSAGSVSKLLVTLDAEGIVDRDDRGGVALVRRRALIHRWVRDYSFVKTNKSVGYFIAPRGLERTMTRLDGTRMVSAVTGSAAARQMLPDGTTPVVPLRLLALYAAAPKALARELGLIDADPITANVVIAEPQDQQVLASVQGETVLAPVALVLADLLTLPNRSHAEAEQLMNMLASDEAAWRERA